MVVQPQKPDQPEIAEITTGSANPIRTRHGIANVPATTDIRCSSARIRCVSVQTAPCGLSIAEPRGIGAPLTEGGPKLVRIDLAANRVTRVYDLASVAQGASFVDDVRFNGDLAYLTDAGRPALIVLDLTTGKSRRVLENHPSTVAGRPLMAEGRQLLDAKGHPGCRPRRPARSLRRRALALLSAPCSGPMSRIETRFLDDPSLDEAALSAHVQAIRRYALDRRHCD